MVTSCSQSAAVCTSALLTLCALCTCSGAGPALQATPLVVALAASEMVERLAAMSYDVSVERDWLVQLVGPLRVTALAESNAWLRRLDLSCELLGTLVFGVALSRFGPQLCLRGVVFMVALSLPVQVAVIQLIQRIAPSVSVNTAQRATHSAASSPKLPPPGSGGGVAAAAAARDRPARSPALGVAAAAQRMAAAAASQLAGTVHSWGHYLGSPVLLCSLAFILLFFNVVLAPSGLMTAFLTANGMPGAGAAAFRSTCAMMGFFGTLLGRQLISRIGLLNSGCAALCLQSALLGCAVVIYTTAFAPGSASSPVLAGTPLPLLLMCLLVVVSRLGLWSFDMVNSQVFQMATPQKRISSVSSSEQALCSLAELSMMGVAAWGSDPRNFGGLVYLSFGSVLAGTLLFCSWVLLLGGGSAFRRAVSANAQRQGLRPSA